jgi:hypothetical protein
MKGVNELRLNNDTMCEAIQYWLDAQMPGRAPTVTSVAYANNSTGPLFIVRTEKEGP